MREERENVREEHGSEVLFERGALGQEEQGAEARGGHFGRRARGEAVSELGGEAREERVRGREGGGAGAEEDGGRQDGVLLARERVVEVAVLRALERLQEADEGGAELCAGVGRRVRGGRYRGHEALEEGEGLRDHAGLAGWRGQDRGEDVEDAGVQVGFDDGGEDVRGVDEGGERGGEERDGFLREGVARGGFAVVEAGDEPGEDEDHDAGELEELLDVVGEVLVAVGGAGISLVGCWMVRAVVIPMVPFRRGMPQTQVSCNLHNDRLHLQSFGENKPVQHVHGLREHHFLVDSVSRHRRPQYLLERLQDLQDLLLGCL